MASVFTKIISGEIPAYRVHEDELTISILTIEPIQLGHCLVIPKQEVNHWYDCEPKAYEAVAQNAQMLAKAIVRATGCKRVLQATVGFEVPHYHLHLIPSWDMTDLLFSKAHKRTQAEMEVTQRKIIEELEKI